MNINFDDIYSRNELLWGKEAQHDLLKKHVIIVGLGGVGSFAAEALARSGVGKLTIVDFDTVSESNINRQLLATTSNINKSKTELMASRIKDINPMITVISINEFYTEQLGNTLFNDKVDFVVDAIDTLRFKIDLIVNCKNKNIPIISSVGAGNRLDPTKLFVTDLAELNPKKCVFAKNVKYRLKRAGIISDLPVVYSDEKPFSLEKVKGSITVNTDQESISLTKFTPGSSPFVPPVAGYIMASFVIRSFIKK